MKAIALPIKDLRLLSNQIQNFQGGYTVEQIRLLDKACSAMDVVLKDFNAGLKKVVDKPKKAGDVKEIEDYVEKEGSKVVTCDFEDADFKFIESVWAKMAGFSGQDIARKAIISIDDAIKSASSPTFSN